MYSISSVRPSCNSFGSIHVKSIQHVSSSSVGLSPSSGTGAAKCSSPTWIAPCEIIWRLMALNIATTTDARYSNAASVSLFVTCLCLYRAESFRLHTCTQQRREVVTWRTSRKKLGLLSVLQSSEFSSVVFKAENPTLFHWLLQSEPFTKSQLRCMRHKPRRIEYCCGLARIQLMHNSMISSSLRPSTPLNCLSNSSIFSNTSVLLDANLFMDCSTVNICSGAAAAVSSATSSVL